MYIIVQDDSIIKTWLMNTEEEVRTSVGTLSETQAGQRKREAGPNRTEGRLETTSRRLLVIVAAAAADDERFQVIGYVY